MNNKIIFKYQLNIQDFQVIYLPSDFKILKLDIQDGNPCLWCEVDNSSDMVNLNIHMRPTGFSFTGIEHNYIGTIGELYVWHFYWENLK